MRIVAVTVICILAWSSSLLAQDPILARTLSGLLSRSEAVVIGVPGKNAVDLSSVGVLKVPFTVVRLVKDDRSVRVDSDVIVNCRSRQLLGERFLLLRSKERDGASRWTVEQAVSGEAVQHLLDLSQKDLSDAKRLEFFFDFLEDSDPMIAKNADLEFLLASGQTFESFCEPLDPVEIRERLAQESLPVLRHRLYLAMLAKCGDASDADWIEPRLAKFGDTPGVLDACLSAYLALKGEAGLEFLEERYLTDAESDFVSTYSAMLALRYASDHPQLGMSVDRLRRSHRLLLDHPLLIDVAIENLARVEDWSSMNRIVDLGKASDERAIQVATINFLRRCPGENAKAQLSEMAKRYPKVYQRAITFTLDSVLKANRAGIPASIRWTGRPGGC